MYTTKRESILELRLVCQEGAFVLSYVSLLQVEREGLMAKDQVYHQTDPDYNYATVGTGEEVC